MGSDVQREFSGYFGASRYLPIKRNYDILMQKVSKFSTVSLHIIVNKNIVY